MPPKKAKDGDDAGEAQPVAIRTRQGAFHYTRMVLSECVHNDAQRSACDKKLVAKELNDSFLPHWNMTSLKSRVGLDKEQASVFMQSVRELQRKQALPKARAPSDEDYTAVVANIDTGQYGDQQSAIDDYVRETGVMCSNSTVSRRVRGILPAGRGRHLSAASINTITDLLYAATSATDCKPANSARRFVRAFAMLERRFGIAAE